MNTNITNCYNNVHTVKGCLTSSRFSILHTHFQIYFYKHHLTVCDINFSFSPSKQQTLIVLACLCMQQFVLGTVRLAACPKLVL